MRQALYPVYLSSLFAVDRPRVASGAVSSLCEQEPWSHLPSYPSFLRWGVDHQAFHENVAHFHDRADELSVCGMASIPDAAARATGG